MARQLGKIDLRLSNMEVALEASYAARYLPSASNGTSARQQLRPEVLDAYGSSSVEEFTRCVVTGEDWPATADGMVMHVRAGHIFRRSWLMEDWVSDIAGV